MYEYLVANLSLSFTDLKGEKTKTEFLNDYAKSNWRVISVIRISSSYYEYTFERLLQQ